MCRRVLLIALFALAPIVANAQGLQRCNLDTSSPALTRDYLPIHGGSFQNIFGYNGPAEYPPFTMQGHEVCPTCNGMVFNAALGLLNPASTHLHVETCLPYLANITGPIVVPFRIRDFHMVGTFYVDDAPMVRNVVFDNPPDDGLTWHKWQGDPMGVGIVTGHFTFDPFAGDSGPNLHQAMKNGWTIFAMSARALLANGDNFGVLGSVPMFTQLDLSVPEDLTFKPDMAVCVGFTSASDPQDAWASQCIEPTRFGTLPILAPININSDWPIADLNGYEYASIIDGSHGHTSVCVDLDLHNGNPGRCFSVGLEGPGRDGNTGPAVLHAADIGLGKHTLFFIWQTDSGPNGVPDPDTTPCLNGTHTDGNICQAAAIPNETVVALFGVPIEVTADAPPNTTCTNPAVANFGQLLPCDEEVIAGVPVAAPVTAQLASVSVDPASIEWNSTATGTVTLAQTSGDRIVVDLRSFNEFVGVPGQVTIAPGQLSVTFPITAGDRNGPGSAQINATSANTVFTTLSLAGGVVPPPPPPATCQDVTATNNGGPLPCVFPPPVIVKPPPPTPTWTQGTVFSKPGAIGVQFELCPGSDPNDVNCQPK